MFFYCFINCKSVFICRGEEFLDFFTIAIWKGLSDNLHEKHFSNIESKLNNLHYLKKDPTCRFQEFATFRPLTTEIQTKREDWKY